MTYIRQTLANSAKDPIPGLHRPPGHSTLRSSEHMQYMCPEAALDERDRSTRLLLLLSVCCAFHVQALPRPCGCIDWSLCSPMLIEHWSTIGPRLHTVVGSRPHRQHINRWRVWRAFNGQGGGRVGGRTSGVQRAHLQRCYALPPMFDASPAGTAELPTAEGTAAARR